MKSLNYTAICFCLAAALQAQDSRFTVTRHLGVTAPLTTPSNRSARDVARDYTAQALPGADQGSIYISREYTDEHNGVTHIIYRQQFQGVDVLNAAWTIHVDSQGRVLSAGGSLYGAPTGALPEPGSALQAARAATHAVNPAAAAKFQPFLSQKKARLASGVRFAAGVFPDDIDGRLVWYALNGKVRPAWVFYITDIDGANRYETVIDGDTSLPIARRTLTHFQKAQGLVFTKETPYPNPAPGALLTEPPPFVDRATVPFTGDPAASPRGWITGTETSGNNIIAGENLLGTYFLRTPATAKAPNLDFTFPLTMGPGAPAFTQFADAVTTNLFYWANRAHDLHYSSGFTEAAGNFQLDNFGKGGIAGDPLYVYSHFGAQAAGRPQIENSFYTSFSGRDGDPSMVAMFLSTSGPGGFYTDGGLDATVILHEYTHGVSERLLPQDYDTFQVAAMGEAWSDFFAFEYTLPDGAPLDGAYNIGEYFLWTWGQSPFRSRPYSTDLNINPLAFSDLGRVISYPEVHADGEIWFEALWEMRANLIRQFGEKEGRRRTRVLTLDGLKFMPPFSTMVDARDAILLADRTDFNGASQDQLWAAFAKRGLGATAYSTSGDSVHIRASFDVPSKKAKVAFYDDAITIGEPVRVIVSDTNNTAKVATVQFVGASGDVETLQLARQGSIFVGIIGTSGNVINPGNGTLNLINGDYLSVYYTDYDTGSGAEQMVATINSRPAYALTGIPSTFEIPAGERALQPGQRFMLPFAFPFFDKKYASVIVDEAGALLFGETRWYGGGCTDRSTLATIPAIAPFWINMTTQGAAQNREGIFYSYSQNNPHSITFRWAGETVTPFNSAGAPLNFSTTLQDDGAITFNYGSGNTDLAGASTPAGCSPGPTAGISPGHDVYTRALILPSWTSAPSVRFDPPFNPGSLPNAVIESPKADDHTQDILTVSGVAWDDQSRATRIDILIDGTQRGSVTPNQARPDFCAKQPVNGCPAIGWNANIRISDLAPGPHTLRIRASNLRSALQDFPAGPMTFFVDPGQGRLPFGKIEFPAAGATVSGTMTVRGYAAINDLRISSVDTIIDGVTYGPTSYNLSRNDVCTTLNPRPLNCPGVGFQVNINTRAGRPPLPDGEHTIQIRVRDETGRYTLLPDSVTVTVHNGDYVPPTGAITSIKNGAVLSGTVTVSGYAYSPGSVIRTVVVYLDDFDFGIAARYGTAVPDVCAALPDVTACPDIGWTATLDTTRLPNGPHTIAAYIGNSRGDTAILPQSGQPTISVVINNP